MIVSVEGFLSPARRRRVIVSIVSSRTQGREHLDMLPLSMASLSGNPTVGEGASDSKKFVST